MKWKKSVHLYWTLVILFIVFPIVYSRPQETSPSTISTSAPKNDSYKLTRDEAKTADIKIETQTITSSRDVKSKTPIIGDSIKMVTTQLLDSSTTKTAERPLLSDTRIPPKLKNQLANKHKIKIRNDDGNEPLENAHVGVAEPVSMEELDSEPSLESSTSSEGISTWVLVSNPDSKDILTNPTEATKIEQSQKKPKPISSKNKTKRPQSNKIATEKRPIIGSTNKSDLVAGGSAISENVYNKIKDTVLTNVLKNKNASTQKTTTADSSTETNLIDTTIKKKDVVSKTSTSVTTAKTSSKPKNKNKSKHKASSTVTSLEYESSLLALEAKEQEIELEVSTPATTTKKPKRNSTRKKNKTKKRKTSTSKPSSETGITEVKTSNKTKSSKHSKKPSIDTTAITSQIYNYFSREVMPSVGVGVIGLAGLVGLASYFFYPFSTPVRRTFEVDKKDDLYGHNAEEYASEGNGQAEEEMLGTVLAGMPAYAKQKLNPYAGQTAQINRYPVKKEQDIRYRHVGTNYDPNYSNRYPQQKTGIAHAAVYSDPVDYSIRQYESQHTYMYTTEPKYNYDKPVTYPAAEPIYAAPQTGPSAVSSYGSKAVDTVVYGMKPADDSDFKPVYPYEGQIYSEVTSSPITYPPTSMYLGSNNDAEEQEQNTEDINDDIDNKFVVGNIPKEFSDSATPAVVPEHGPRNLSRKKRSIRAKRNITASIEEALLSAMKNKEDVFLSNEVDGVLTSTTTSSKLNTEAIPVLTVSTDPNIEKHTQSLIENQKLIESVSTLPIENSKYDETTTETLNELEPTTKDFKINEMFVTNDAPKDFNKFATFLDSEKKSINDTTTDVRSINTETTTEQRSERISTMPPNKSSVFDTKDTDSQTITSTAKSTPTYYPEVITYPPLNQDGGGFFTLLKRLIEFKYRLGLSILQTTSESLNRYLRSMENSTQKVAYSSNS